MKHVGPVATTLGLAQCCFAQDCYKRVEGPRLRDLPEEFGLSVEAPPVPQEHDDGYRKLNHE